MNKIPFIRVFMSIMLYSAVLLVPFQLYFDVYGSLSLTVAELLVLLLSGLCVVYYGNIKRFLFFDTDISPLVLFFCLSMLISSIFAIDAVISFKFSIKWIAITAGYFGFYHSIRLVSSRENIFTILMITASITSLIGISFYIIGPKGFESFLASATASIFIDPSTVTYGEMNWFRGGGIGGTFFNRNWYVAYLSLVIPYCCIRAIIVKEKRWFWSVGTIILLTGLMLSFSRGGWIGFFCSVLSSILLMKKKSWKIFVIIIVIVMIIFITLKFFSPSLWENLLLRGANILVVDYRINRLSIWASSLNALETNPLFGVGIANNPIGSAHSNYLQIATEQGIVGLTIFILILYTLLKKVLINILRAERTLDHACGLAIIGSWTWFSVQGFLSTTLFNDKMFMAFTCLLALSSHFALDQESDN